MPDDLDALMRELFPVAEPDAERHTQPDPTPVSRVRPPLRVRRVRNRVAVERAA